MNTNPANLFVKMKKRLTFIDKNKKKTHSFYHSLSSGIKNMFTAFQGVTSETFPYSFNMMYILFIVQVGILVVWSRK